MAIHNQHQQITIQPSKVDWSTQQAEKLKPRICIICGKRPACTASVLGQCLLCYERGKELWQAKATGQ